MLTDLNISVDHSLLQQALLMVDDNDAKTILNKPTGDFFYDPWVISEEYKGTPAEKILSHIPETFGEARIIVLKSGTCYHSHADIDDRYHVNLSGTYSFLIDIDSKKMFTTTLDGKLYHMNAGIRHVAANFGSTDRVQLVVRKLLNKVNLTNPITVEISPICDKARFIFDDEISPWLNLINKKQLMSNFKILDYGVKFDMEKEIVHELENFSKEKFKILIS
jgi:hypothetical protein